MRNILIGLGCVVVVAGLVVAVYFGLLKGGTQTPSNVSPAKSSPASSSPAASPMPSPAAASPSPATPAPGTQVAQLPVPAGMDAQPGDHVLGDPKAPITIIEYASLTCPHCAYFSVNTFPELKKQYIDTGKAKLVFRDFPLDEYAARGSQMAECAGNDRYFALIEILFASQRSWIKINDVAGTIAELGKIARLAGVPEADFKACMANDGLLQSIIAERQAGEKMGVESTPTFFINGKKAEGAMPFAEFEKLLK
jgi:protein-disulfide isomerase